jgi:predicted RNA-binding protein with PUA-like domain
MKKGDLAFIYHTGKERALIGIAAVASDPYPDPTQKDPRFAVVDMKAKQELSRTVSLKEIKSDATFSDFLLVRIGRLSVMPVTPS